MIVVRQAKPEDADSAVKAVRRSITELCAEDHQGDEKTLDYWLSNKTPEYFRSWLADKDNFCAVAEIDGQLAGVALLHRSGEIKLFYLAPGMQRRGAGRALHAALEQRAKEWGLESLHLNSTALAKPFYEALGYHSIDVAKPHFGVLCCQPYEKTL